MGLAWGEMGLAWGEMVLGGGLPCSTDQRVRHLRMAGAPNLGGKHEGKEAREKMEDLERRRGFNLEYSRKNSK